MLAQCAQFRPTFVVMASTPHAHLLIEKLKQNSLHVQVLIGSDALEIIASHPDVDTVMAAIVGAAGLPSCMAAARAGKRLLLANKEALVLGGDFFMEAVKAGGAQLVPIDSEHSAIFQCLPDDASTWAACVEKIILTASGGPFLRRAPAALRNVTPDEACAHPNWVMGRKISVDSATMMNKALEVIEAHYLFNLEPAQIEVLIHPQSIVHSMVQYKDASVVAQLGTPDMRGPIAYGLAWPERIVSGARPLDFASLPAMTFAKPDHNLFPGLALAWRVLNAVPGSTAVLNAANEVAVAAFLAGQIRFDQIYHVNHATLEAVPVSEAHGIDDVMAFDGLARRCALSIAKTLEH